MYPEVNIGPHSTVEKRFDGVTNVAGELHIRAKWHTGASIPNLFNKLKVEVLRDGNVVATDEGYSIHSDQKGKTDKIDIRINIGANQGVGWKLRIINNENADIKGFAIEKGNDANPFVPSFRSTYKPCS